MAQCGTTPANIGLAACMQTPDYLDKIVFLQRGTSIPIADLNTSATWEDLFNATIADRAYVLEIANYESTFGEPQYEEFASTGKSKLSGYSKKTQAITLTDMGWRGAKKIKTHDGIKYDILYVTKSNEIIGATTDNVNLVGFEVERLNIGEYQEALQGTVAKMMLNIQFKDSQADTLNYYVETLTIDNDYFRSIMDLVGSNATISATEIELLIKTYTGSEQTNLVTADFIVTKAGTPVSVTATNVGGVYTLTGTFTTGAHIVGLKNQPTMTTKYVEMPTTVSVTL